MLSEKFSRWDAGEYTYSSVEEALLKIPEGEKISKKALDLLGECTVCAVGNASCLNFFKITVHGVHPEKPIKEKTILICPMGCTAENCLLNK